MATLSPSVASLRSSLSLLSSSISLLSSDTSDLPRLRTVLTSHSHFELLPESQLREAQSALHEEITPAITTLLAIAEREVGQLKRREEGMRARSELLEGRVERKRHEQEQEQGGESRSGSRGTAAATAAAGNARGRKTGTAVGGGGLEGNDEALAAELKRLRQKKERLKLAVGTLELQSRQRERELRRSTMMAVVND